VLAVFYAFVSCVFASAVFDIAFSDVFDNVVVFCVFCV
tara:strand:+ start:6331 stop:6444 length:114 start_codon:yes stop_codon:yes gene_type:complete